MDPFARAPLLLLKITLRSGRYKYTGGRGDLCQLSPVPTLSFGQPPIGRKQDCRVCQNEYQHVAIVWKEGAPPLSSLMMHFTIHFLGHARTEITLFFPHPHELTVLLFSLSKSAGLEGTRPSVEVLTSNWPHGARPVESGDQRSQNTTGTYFSIHTLRSHLFSLNIGTSLTLSDQTARWFRISSLTIKT